MNTIPFLACLQGTSAQVAAPFLLNQGNPLRIDRVNWPRDFAACPETVVHLATSMDTLYIRYDVTGQQLRALASKDQMPVWRDSCVEFFCQLPNKKSYMNFETNCIGSMVASRREGRDKNVRVFTPEQMALIDRYASEGREPFAEKDGVFSWFVVIAIPWSLITNGKGKPASIMANFYKCADDTKQPHYVSWSPINLPHPDFHCPEFFSELRVQG